MLAEVTQQEGRRHNVPVQKEHIDLAAEPLPSSGDGSNLSTILQFKATRAEGEALDDVSTSTTAHGDAAELAEETYPPGNTRSESHV